MNFVNLLVIFTIALTYNQLATASEVVSFQEVANKDVLDETNSNSEEIFYVPIDSSSLFELLDNSDEDETDVAKRANYKVPMFDNLDRKYNFQIRWGKRTKPQTRWGKRSKPQTRWGKRSNPQTRWGKRFYQIVKEQLGNKRGPQTRWG